MLSPEQTSNATSSNAPPACSVAVDVKPQPKAKKKAKKSDEEQGWEKPKQRRKPKDGKKTASTANARAASDHDADEILSELRLCSSDRHSLPANIDSRHGQSGVWPFVEEDYSYRIVRLPQAPPKVMDRRYASHIGGVGWLTGFRYFPREILVAIFSPLLTDFDAVVTLSNVCKGWRTFVLSISTVVTKPLLLRMQASFPNLLNLDLTGVSIAIDSLWSLSAVASKLTRLCARFLVSLERRAPVAHSTLGSRDHALALATFTALRSLSLRAYPRPLLGAFPHLHTLEATQCHQKSASVVMPSLTALTYRNGSSLVYSTRIPHTLRVLALGRGCRDNPATILRSATGLRELRLHDKYFHHLECPSLQVLHLEQWVPTWRDMFWLHNLRILHVNSAKVYSGASFHFPLLEELWLSKSSLHMFVPLMKDWPKLRRVIAEDCEGVTPEALEAFRAKVEVIVRYTTDTQ